MYLTLEEYALTLRMIDAKTLAKKQTFLDKYMLPNLNYNNLKTISLFYKSRVATFGDIIFREGEPIEFIYAIVSGEVSIKKQEYSVPLQNISGMNKIKQGFFKKLIKKKPILQKELMRISVGGHLGLDSYFSSDKYEYSVTVVSESAEFYYLNTKNMDRLSKDYPEFKQELRQKSSKLKVSRAMEYFKRKEISLPDSSDEQIQMLSILTSGEGGAQDKAINRGYWMKMKQSNNSLDRKVELLNMIYEREEKNRITCNPSKKNREREIQDYYGDHSTKKDKYGLPKILIRCDFDPPTVIQRVRELKEKTKNRPRLKFNSHGRNKSLILKKAKNSLERTANSFEHSFTSVSEASFTIAPLDKKNFIRNGGRSFKLENCNLIDIA